MPPNKSDRKKILATAEAFNAAFEAQAGISELVFHELHNIRQSTIPEQLAAFIQGANVVYSSQASSLSRTGGSMISRHEMRKDGDFTLKSNKVGIPQFGRFGSDATVGRGDIADH